MKRIPTLLSPRLFAPVGGCFFALLLLVQLPSQVQAQANPDSQLKYIDIIPPSPAVAKIAEYSRPDVGLSSGTAQFHLPITSISLGSFNLPIGLNYSSNGVKVDVLSSRVGVDFQLEAGGAITRTVRGNGPDELSTFLNFPGNLVPSTRGFVDYMDKVTSYSQWAPGGYDSEPDLFSYSFGGTGGSFVLDSARQVYQIPKTNSVITTNFNGTSWNFKIADASGNEYYFGGTGYTETNQRYQSCSHPTTGYNPITAWFLQKIILYNGDVITFNYLPVSYRYDVGVSQTLYSQSVAQSQPNSSPDCSVCPVNQNSTCVSYFDVNSYYLSSITTARGQSVNFSYTTRNDCGDKLLTGITKSYNSNVTDTYQLNYTEVQSNSYAPSSLAISTDIHYRYFLKSVTRLFNGAYIKEYDFTYNDPAGLPVRLTFAQDHWGYFNAKNNSILIPYPNTNDLVNKFPTATANRDPDTLACKKGLLTKIQYVTGGYDSITYQSNAVYQTRTIYPTTPDTFSPSGLQGVQSTTLMGTFTIGFEQMVTLDLRNIIDDPSYTPDPLHSVGLLTIKNSAGTVVQSYGSVPGDPFNPQKFDFVPGVYSVYLSNTWAHGSVYIYVTYIPGTASVITKNWPVGGVRVGGITSKSFDGKLIGKKRYVYSQSGSTHSSAVMNYAIQYDKGYTYTKWCWDAALDYTLQKTRDCSYAALFSSATGNIFSSSGSSVNYAYVCELTDDTGANGLVEHNFLINPDTHGNLILGAAVLGATPSNTSALNHGKEIKTTYYQRNGSTFQMQRRITNTYATASMDILTGCITSRYYLPVSGRTGTPQPDELAPLEATDYFIYAPWTRLDQTLTEEFSSNGQVLSTTTKYTYDPATLLPSATTTTDGYGNTTVTNSYYSGMLSIPGASPLTDPVFGAMRAKNKIGQLIYQQTITNKKPVNTHRVLMATIGSTGMVLPQEIRETNTASNSEETLFTISQYDAYGNILERKRRDGVYHSFRWNYFGTYPVAEAVGAAAADMDATSFESNSFGGWVLTGSPSATVALTGGSSFPLSSTTQVARTGLTAATTYVVSFWSNAGSAIKVNNVAPTTGKTRKGWVYNEITVSGVTSVTVTGTAGNIDELRVYPKGAQMTTYTYDPEIGITSSTDPNHVTSYFEYDGLKRLVTVRDDRNNILKTNQYHFYSAN